jgi:hypothetical protein
MPTFIVIRLCLKDLFPSHRLQAQSSAIVFVHIQNLQKGISHFGLSSFTGRISRSTHRLDRIIFIFEEQLPVDIESILFEKLIEVLVGGVD